MYFHKTEYDVIVNNISKYFRKMLNDAGYSHKKGTYKYSYWRMMAHLVKNEESTRRKIKY